MMFFDARAAQLLVEIDDADDHTDKPKHPVHVRANVVSVYAHMWRVEALYFGCRACAFFFDLWDWGWGAKPVHSNRKW